MRKKENSLEEIERIKKFLEDNTKVLHNPLNRYEVPLFGELNGHRIKGKPDILRIDEEKGMIIDLKFTDKDITTDTDISRLFWNSRWDIQAAMYQELVRQNFGMELPFIFIVVNKKSKFIEIRKVLVNYEDDPNSIHSLAIRDINRVLDSIKESYDAGVFEAERKAFIPTSRPKYI